MSRDASGCHGLEPGRLTFFCLRDGLRDVRGKTLSILGFGRLGQALLPVARALGFKILVWSPNLTQERIAGFGDDISTLPLLPDTPSDGFSASCLRPNVLFRSVVSALASSLHHLLSSADVLTLQIVYSPSTRHILGKEQLGWLKPSTFLVNTSRGGLIDEEALVEVLREKRIRVSSGPLCVHLFSLEQRRE